MPLGRAYRGVTTSRASVCDNFAGAVQTEMLPFLARRPHAIITHPAINAILRGLASPFRN